MQSARTAGAVLYTTNESRAYQTPLNFRYDTTHMLQKTISLRRSAITLKNHQTDTHNIQIITVQNLKRSLLSFDLPSIFLIERYCVDASQREAQSTHTTESVLWNFNDLLTYFIIF